MAMTDTPKNLSSFGAASIWADALSLGSHWVYNQDKLERLYPKGITEPTDPASSYHPNRKAGQNTHYGDQTRMLQESISRHGGFDPDRWRSDWVDHMKAYDGYLDGASSKTLEQQGGRSSASNDLAGASRLGPILDLGLPLNEAVQAARAQTALTHGDPGVSDAAEFFVRAVHAIKRGHDMAAALDLAAAEGDYPDLEVVNFLESAKLADPDDFRKVSNSMGLTCHLPEAFPLTLYFALRPKADFPSAISDNGLAGGDTSARAMLLAVLFEARDGYMAELNPTGQVTSSLEVKPASNAVEFSGPSGRISGVLEMPEQSPKAFALFAHCFTCGKDFFPEKRITQGLAREGIATLRIDFAGIGQSDGAFKDSSFVTNLHDLRAGATWLTEHFRSPQLLIGHSLGGAAALGAASILKGVKAVVTIAAPSDPGHVTHLFENHLETIETSGAAEVDLAGRTFVIGKRFLDDFKTYCHREALKGLSDMEFLLLHAPGDTVVPIDNAGEIFSALRHPKSFISLGSADHLLTRKADTEYVAQVVAAWAQRALR